MILPDGIHAGIVDANAGEGVILLLPTHACHDPVHEQLQCVCRCWWLDAGFEVPHGGGSGEITVAVPYDTRVTIRTESWFIAYYRAVLLEEGKGAFHHPTYVGDSFCANDHVFNGAVPGKACAVGDVEAC